jgi:hypothetical protein
MPRPTQLAAVPTEALVNELKSRFAAIEKAKELLFGNDGAASTHRRSSERAHVPSTGRKFGGTSPYARSVSKLVQTIRHAKGRGENVTKFQKRLDRLRAQHGKA